MKKTYFDIQFFAKEDENLKSVTNGKEIIYLFRPISKQKEQDARVLMFTTENSRKKTKDADSKATKDGPIRTPSEVEQEINYTCRMVKGDDLPDQLEEAMDNGELVEVWEVNKGVKSDDGKYKCKYFQGYLTSYECSSPADDMVELTGTIGVNGAGVTDYVQLTEEQEASAEYVFQPLEKITDDTSKPAESKETE